MFQPSFLRKYFGEDFSNDDALKLIDDYKNLRNQPETQDQFILSVIKKYKLNSYETHKVFNLSKKRFTRLIDGRPNKNPSYSFGTIQDLILFENFQSTFFLDKSNKESVNLPVDLPFNLHNFYLDYTALWYPGGKSPDHPLIRQANSFYYRLGQIRLGKYNSEANMDVKDALPTAASAASTFDDSTTPAFTSPTNQFDSNDALLTDEDNTSGKFETVGTCWK